MPKVPFNSNRRTTTKRTSKPRTVTHRTKSVAKRKKSNRTIKDIEVKLRLLLVRLTLICGAALMVYFFYIYVVERYHSKWQALYGNEVYPDGYSIHGIDISHHQGDIDWEKL